MKKKIYMTPAIKTGDIYSEENLLTASLEDEIIVSGGSGTTPPIVVDPEPATPGQGSDARGYSLWDDEF